MNFISFYTTGAKYLNLANPNMIKNFKLFFSVMWLSIHFYFWDVEMSYLLHFTKISYIKYELIFWGFSFLCSLSFIYLRIYILCKLERFTCAMSSNTLNILLATFLKLSTKIKSLYWHLSVKVSSNIEVTFCRVTH